MTNKRPGARRAHRFAGKHVLKLCLSIGAAANITGAQDKYGIEHKRRYCLAWMLSKSSKPRIVGSKLPMMRFQRVMGAADTYTISRAFKMKSSARLIA